MKLIKSIVVMIVVLATTLAHAGDSVPFRLDTVTISTSPVVDSLSISWDASWIGGNANATVVIADNGVEVKRTMGSGEFTYTFPGGGRHELTYTTYIGSVAQEDVYTTTFYFPNVFFDATGGNVDEQFRCVNPGGTIGILPTPTRIGYTFAGWWTTASGGTQISDSTIITDYVTNHAHWTINQYTVTFDANGGTGGTSVTQDYDTPIVVPVVTNEGVGDWWFFAYWSPAVAATVPASNVTYTAQWRRWCDSISASKMGNKTMKQLYPADYTYMTTVILEEGIKELPEGFFNGCTALENLTIPLSLEEFGYDDLPPRIKERLEYDANGFKIFGNWVLDYQDRSASAVTIPNGIVGIGRGAFEEMFDLETVKFPEESLTAIARGAFKDCSWMQEVAFPSSLRHVGQQAFKDCTSLLRATFADGLLYIGASAFSGCWQMQSVRIPYTVTSIGSGAFSGCGNIRGVTVPTHLMTMQSFFPDAYSKIETAEVASGETRVMDGMFADCAALRGGATQTDMSMIPDSVTNIGARAFQNCTALTAFVVPDSVVQMGVSVFRNCTNLWNVTLSRNLAAIPDYAFYGCTMLETMIVPASVTYLGSQFFSGRTDPDSGIDIENALYYLCTNAPSYHSSAYAAISGNMTTYVLQNSRSWDGRQGSRVLPQTWNGHAITYWTPNSFDVTFDANGGQFGASGGSTWNERQITDTTYALPSTEPTRPGWVFEGWWTEETGGAEVRYSTTVTATRTHTLYAHWRSLGESMTVTFNSNGGTTVVPGTQDYVPGQTFGQFPVPTRRGYLFVGWYLTARMDGEIVSAETVVSSNVTWYAQWIKDPLGTYSTGQDAIQPTPYSGTEATWTVQFETRGGTLDAKYRSMAVPRGAKFGLLPVPTRAGYAFAGWCTSPADAGLVTEATQVPAADMELFAHWMPITYYVRFNANGGLGGMECQAFLFDGQQSLKTHTFTHSQSAFAGWATTPSGQVRYAENASVVNLEEVHGRIVDLYAVWMGAGYSVRFDANGGTGYMDNQTIALGETRNLWPCAFTWAGYAFAGWALSPTAASAGNVAYRDGQAVKNLATANGATVPLYAVWVAAAQTARITFDANGGSVAPDYWNCVVGTAVEAFPTPTRPGFTFAGWWTAKTGGTQVESIARVTSAQTFYAHWAENGSVTPGDGTCIVTFNPNGGSVGETTRQMAEGSSLVMLPTPTRTGFTFAGWWTAANGGVQVSAATIVTGSVTYYAHWNHLVAFDANGGSLGTASPTRLVAEGDAVGTLPVPERADYLFAGWWTAVSNGTQIAATTVVPSNMTYYALWNCTVTFNANGGSLDTASSSRLVMENTEIGELPGAVRTGYAFAGWWTAASGGAQISASTVVTAAVTNYAHWTANTYFVSFSATGGMGTYNQQMVYDEAAALLPNRFDKAGSLFRGWATTLGGAVVYGDGAIVRNLSARANDVVTLYAVWQEKPASVLACEEAFAGTAEVALDADDNIVVTLTNDVSGTVEIPDNVGGIAIDLNGHDMIGNGGLGETALPDGPAIRIVSGDGDGEATSLAIVDTSDGEKGQIAGGGESAGIEIAEDAASRVWLDVDDGIAVLNGDGSEQDWKELLSVEATLTVGKYFTATLTELGYDVPTDGTAYEVKAYGLPAGLKLVSNKAVTKKVGKKTV
ncbi:MAG: InlB B-repeat-containing protein, partial [Kiritimatiellae bacterium]|nr:InlB B-repeat-containing protein [Kiritimatiellia bacterium]